MKVLLVSVSLEFPLANYCLAAQLRGSDQVAGCGVELLDLDWQRLSHYERKNAEIWRYIARIELTKPDIVGFSVYLWNNLIFRELALITHRLFPSIQIVVGGPEIATTETAESWLRDGTVSVAVRGEGEHTFEQVVLRLAQSGHTRGIRGTSVADDGCIVHEPPGLPVRDLENLPSPFLSGVAPIELFERRNTPPGSSRFARVLMETYRGCYMQCGYCQWGNGTKTRFAFSEDRLHRELSLLLLHDVRMVFIVDAMFGYKKAGAIELLEYIVQEKARLHASTEFTVYHNQDFFDPRLFRLYREAGVYIELDLQSTNELVLERLGRGRWKKDTFERHLQAVREERVPTTGAADLIIGIPGDDLRSFENSVDYLLHHRMNINLYQASVLPDTDWSRRTSEDGTVYSPLPPRAIFTNATFPLRDMVIARLIGHGTDFFNYFPRTAEILWRRWFARPVDLCRAVGELIFTDHGLMYGESHQYDWVMKTCLPRLPDIIRQLCPDASKAEILIELMKFEGAIAGTRWARRSAWLSPAVDWRVIGAEWLDERPVFRRECVERIEFRYLVTHLVMEWDRRPDPAIIDAVIERPRVVLFYNDGQPQHFAIDAGVTDRLLRRLNGYFSIGEGLANIGLRLPDMAPLWNVLGMLAECGIIAPGYDENGLEQRIACER